MFSYSKSDLYLHHGGSVSFLSTVPNNTRDHVCCRLLTELADMRLMLHQAIAIRLPLDNPENGSDCSTYQPQLAQQEAVLTTDDMEAAKESMRAEAQRIASLQALASDSRNHLHLVEAYRKFCAAALPGVTTQTVRPGGQVQLKKACVAMGLKESMWGSLKALLNKTISLGTRPRWASMFITAIYKWHCSNNTEDSPFEEVMLDSGDSPFELAPEPSVMSTWYARVPPMARVTTLSGHLTFTLAAGAVREIALNQQYHLLFPDSWSSEHPILNFYYSNEGQDLSTAWRLDSAEFTPDLASLVEIKNCFVARDVFSQVGDRGRYTLTVQETHPDLRQCRIAIIINVPTGFIGSNKHNNLTKRATEQEVHLLYWQAQTEDELRGYIALIQRWQTSCRQNIPFCSHELALLR